MARPKKETLPTGPKVTMHNTLVRASHGLNLGEKRLVSIAVSKLSHTAAVLPGKPIRISAHEFAEAYGLDQSDAYKQLRAAQDKLWHRTIRHIEHYGSNGSKVEVVRMRWVTSARYKDHEGEIGISFAPEIAQFLVQLKKHFTSYQLKQASALRSVYSWRLFETSRAMKALANGGLRWTASTRSWKPRKATRRTSPRLAGGCWTRPLQNWPKKAPCLCRLKPKSGVGRSPICASLSSRSGKWHWLFDGPA